MEISGLASFSTLYVGLVIGGLGRLISRKQLNILAVWAIGVAAALLGTIVVNTLGMNYGQFIDWFQFALQVGLATAGIQMAPGK